MHKCNGDCFCDPHNVAEAATTVAGAIAIFTAQVREQLN
jgi:hypothetical protein